jgi:hypothetical protein
MGSVHARGDTFLTFGLKALTETNASRLATGVSSSFVCKHYIRYQIKSKFKLVLFLYNMPCLFLHLWTALICNLNLKSS